MTSVQCIGYSGRAKEDLAFRVDHKSCKRSEEPGASGILVAKNPGVISLRSFLQDSGFHSTDAPCGYLAKGLRRKGIMDNSPWEIKQLEGRCHQFMENKIQIWNWDVPTGTKSKENGWGMRTERGE